VKEALKKGIKKMDPLRAWYGRYERPVSSLSLIGGFVFDALTLKRVDMFWENFWVLGHILVIAILMVMVHAVENEPGDEANPEKLHFWLVNAVQFVFGGVLSVFLVFYFRSGDLSVSWPFLLILALAFWANESLKRHFVRLTFQVSLFFLSLFCCAIFLVPVIVHDIGAQVFLVSGVVSLIFMFLFLMVLAFYSKEKFTQSRKMIFFSVLGIYVSMNILYFTNLIPPIPLSLKDSGAYHFIQKTDNTYIAQKEKSKVINFFERYPEFKSENGGPVYAYSAIFSPTSFKTEVIQVWEHYDDFNKQWIESDRVVLPVVGGREGGFRTYSIKSNLDPGQWRVNVITPRGQLIGRIRFTMVLVDDTPELESEILE
jgi:hypothetical protein